MALETNNHKFLLHLQLSKMYEDYLETFVFKTAKTIAMKLFGRVRKSRAMPDESKAENDEKSLVKKMPESDEPVAEENVEEVESERLLDEAMIKQREEKAKQEKELAAARVEYDSITDGLSEVNFHLPIFYLLLLMTILSGPSIVTWAKNYHFSRVLSPDPTLIPATCVLIALGFIWQMQTPRNL